MRALQHFDDLAIGAAIGFDARDAHQHAVAMHGLTRGIGGDVDVSLYALQRPLCDQETIAVAVHVDAADGVFACARGRHVMAGPGFHQVAARQQAREREVQFRAGCAFAAELAHQLLEIGLGVRQAGDVVEQRRIGHRLIVSVNGIRA